MYENSRALPMLTEDSPHAPLWSLLPCQENILCVCILQIGVSKGVYRRALQTFHYNETREDLLVEIGNLILRQGSSLDACRLIQVFV